MIYDVQQSVELQQKRVEILEDQVRMLVTAVEGLGRRANVQHERMNLLHAKNVALEEKIVELTAYVNALETAQAAAIPVDTHHAEDCDCETCLIQYDARSDFNAHDYYNK